MEAPVSRLPFWLHELIAEAKRRARQRRLLVVLLLVVAAVVTAAVVLRPSGGSPSGLSGRADRTSTSSDFVHFRPFVLTVPKGFHQWGATKGSVVTAFCVARHPRALCTGVRLPARAIYLSVQAGLPPLLARRLPLDLHKLHPSPVGKHGTMWTGGVYGGHEGYSVIVFEGRKASAADRAAIERALRSIRRAS
jgi:hypothetical protein